MLKAFSRARTAMFAAAFVFVFAVFASAQTSRLQNDLQRSFKQFNLVKLNNQIALQKASGGGALVVANAERQFELNLQPRDLRARRYRAEETGAGGLRETKNEAAAVTTFAGRIVGEENDSEVRLSIDEKRGVEGYFISAGEMFFVEPARRYSSAAGADDAIVYRGEDALDQKRFVCNVAEKIEEGKRLVGVNSLNDSPTVAPRVLEMATEADYEFVNALGGAAQANAETLNILNMVEGVYRVELGLTISVVYQHAWTTPDAFATTTTSALLLSFKDYWNANFPASRIPRDAAHLFTGKSAFSGQGLAYLSVVCKTPTSAYGVDGRLDFAPVKFLLTAHEIGHNLGATHVDAAQSCGNTVMNAQLSQNTLFSFCPSSRAEVNTFVSANNGCLSVQAISKTRFDFDGDTRADLTVFRPSGGVWYLLNSGAGVSVSQFGQAGDKPVAGDYDGDGRTDIAIYRAGAWFRLKSSNNTYDVINFGTAGDTPVPADFDGDGATDVAVFRPSSGEWFVSKSRDGAFQSLQFGAPGDVPLPADFDADGKADFNVWRPAGGNWFRFNSGSGNSFAASQLGATGDKPIAGDFDGDGRADLAVYRPSNGGWYIVRSSDNFYYGVGFGIATDVPVAADYDGDGKTDIAVFRPSDGFWYRLNSRDGAFASTQFGANGDIPAPANPGGN